MFSVTFFFVEVHRICWNLTEDRIYIHSISNCQSFKFIVKIMLVFQKFDMQKKLYNDFFSLLNSVMIN